MAKQRALFLVFLLTLVGANIAQVQALVGQWLVGEQLPTTGLFKAVFLFVWLPVACITAWCGLAGGYAALRTNRLTSAYLTWFVVLLCPMVKVEGVDLGWTLFRVSFHIGAPRFAVGVNFLGVAIAYWLIHLRHAEGGSAPTPAHPTSGTESALT